MAELVIYGRDSCGMCNNFKKECEKNNLKYKYLNIEDAAVKAEMFRKVRACSWFKGGRFGLPLVDVYGNMQERPSLAFVLEAQNKLPKSSDVEKIKKQFKDLDANKDGTLDFNEMTKMMKALNSKLSEVQLQKLFCQADVNGNGTVELEEFIDFVMHGKQAVAKVLQEPPQGTPTATGVRDQWKKEVLEAHNAHRKNHSAPPLQWMDECYLSAKKQANACQERSAMYHGNTSGPSGRHGQNIYWCSSPGSDAKEMVYAWYSEVTDPGYNFSDAKFTPGTGHFTQVVWKGTTHVGMALSEDGRFCVANYYPAGNVMGQFASNVLPMPDGAIGASKGGVPIPAGAIKTTVVRKVVKAGDIEWGNASVLEVKAGEDKQAEIDLILGRCPFPYKDKIKEALAGGAQSVTISKQEEKDGPRIAIEVTIKQGCSTSRMRGQYGGG